VTSARHEARAVWLSDVNDLSDFAKTISEKSSEKLASRIQRCTATSLRSHLYEPTIRVIPRNFVSIVEMHRSIVSAIPLASILRISSASRLMDSIRWYIVLFSLVKVAKAITLDRVSECMHCASGC